MWARTVWIAGYIVFGLRAQEPLLDPRLFAVRGFRACGITIVVQFMAVFGFFFVGLQRRRAASSVLWTLPTVMTDSFAFAKLSAKQMIGPPWLVPRE